MKTGNRRPGTGFRGSPAIAALLLAAGCAASRPAQFTDADWVAQATTGRGAYERGDFRRGAEAYARAEARAKALDDADALAVSAANRAVCLLADGKAAEARAGVDDARADVRVSRGRQAELQVLGARAALALAKPEEALARIGEALKLEPPPELRAQALLVQSAAELARGEPGAAEKALAAGLSAPEWARLPASLRAEHTARRAEIAAAENRAAEAAAGQDAAAALWREAGRLPEMARALAEAGRQAKASGDLAAACDRLYRSARSLWAQGLQPEAVRTLEEGVACAEELKDEAAGKRMAELFATFKNGKRISE